jgi:fumarate reductase subunit C
VPECLEVSVATETKPKEYIRPMPADWWLKNTNYALFMLRDVTSIFIAGYCVFLIILMCYASRDAETFRDFYAKLASPWSVVLHLIVLAFALYHSITFFNLTPRVIRVFRGDEKIPDRAIAGAHYALWIVASVVLIVVALVT